AGGGAPGPGGGGGIFNRGALSLSNCTVTGNSAFAGGGIANALGAAMTMSGDTVNNNTATGASGGGGGIENSGNMTVINCTIAANAAIGGGGIANYGGLNVDNSTVAYNTVAGLAPDGGGIYNSGGPTQLSMLNTIVFNPNSGAKTKNDVFGLINQAQGNLFGSLPDGIGGGGDLGGNEYTVDPLLGPLQNNGGPTATMALLPGSPAIAAGVSTSQVPGLAVPATDQRGDPRPATSIDVGAFQTWPPSPQ